MNLKDAHKLQRCATKHENKDPPPMGKEHSH